MVRRATADDIPQIVAMGLTFLTTVYVDRMPPPDPEQLQRTAAWMLESEDRLVLVAEDGGAVVGMIGVFVFPHPMTGQRTAAELFWWVSPEARGRHGLALLTRARAWAKAAGATTLQMIAPDADVARMYERLGFHQVETTYARAL